jgi:hypothetical protein
MLYMFQAVFPPIISANSPTLAVAASKLYIYQMLYVQFELLMMGGKPA